MGYSKGIIPTRVGTRMYNRSFFAFLRDHPHACGDKHKRKQTTLLKEGSSPRVWGQGHNIAEYIKNERIIPTRVGTRYSQSAQVKSSEDHPHACGDKGVKNVTDKHEQGSSPRVWGQVKLHTVTIVHSGIIPTRVGTRQTP